MALQKGELIQQQQHHFITIDNFSSIKMQTYQELSIQCVPLGQQVFETKALSTLDVPLHAGKISLCGIWLWQQENCNRVTKLYSNMVK